MCFSVQVVRNLSELVKSFEALIDKTAFEEFNRLKEEQPNLFKGPDGDDRIYPNTFAPVIVGKETEEGLQRVLTPMRYRLRPHDAAEEVPSKYNLFNARLDSLEKRKSWRGIFGRNHCLFPFKRFYEWVEGEQGKKQLVSFYPKEKEYMWAPGIYDFYKGPEGAFHSFALITREPPSEVLAAGHDRCPLFLEDKNIDLWLTPKGRSLPELYEILTPLEKVVYGVEEASMPQRTSLPKQKVQQNDGQLDLFKKN
jgi:putative SOS response-associated peptidase YedK